MEPTRNLEVKETIDSKEQDYVNVLTTAYNIVL
jgi:hypothetical protein